MIKKILIPLVLLSPVVYAEYQTEQPDIGIESNIQMDALGVSKEKLELDNIKENAKITPSETNIVITSERMSSPKASIVGYAKSKKMELGTIIPNVINEHEIIGLYMKRQGNTCITALELSKTEDNGDLVSINSIQFEGLTEELDFSNAKIVNGKNNISLLKKIKCEYYQTYENMPNIVNKVIIKKETE